MTSPASGFELLSPRGIGATRGRKADLLRPLWLPAGEEISIAPDPEGMTTVRSPMDLRTARNFLPRVAILFGRRGEGKTLWLTAMLKILQQRSILNGTPRKVLTNYWTSFSDENSGPYLLDQLQEFPDWANNSIIGLDEIVDLMPSSRAMSTYSLLTQTFLRQIRKRGCEVIGATQFPQELGRAVLRQVDFFLETELIQYGKGVRTYWHDWWGQFTGQYKQRYWPPERDAHDFAFTLWGTDKMFGHYRTEEVVASVYSDTRDDLINAQWGVDTPPEGPAEPDLGQPSGGRYSFAEIIDMIKGPTVATIEDLLDIAKEDMGLPYLSATKLREMMINMGYDCDLDDEGQWVVSRP